jgi:hypothetical protein
MGRPMLYGMNGSVIYCGIPYKGPLTGNIVSAKLGFAFSGYRLDVRKIELDFSKK